MKNAVCLTILGSILILVSAPYLPAAEIYTWTDKDGNLHITKSPPPKGSKLKEVTSYSVKAETQGSDIQESQDGPVSDREGIKKSKEVDEAQRKADTAAQKAHEASAKASDAALKAYELKNKRAYQGRQVRQPVSDDDVIKAEGKAMRAEEESKEAWEKAKKASDKAEAAQERAKE
jgi:hypothetical protein